MMDGRVTTSHQYPWTPGGLPGGNTFTSLNNMVRTFHFCRDKDLAAFSLVGSRRIVPTHAIRGVLDSWCHLRIKTPYGDSDPSHQR